tara:strand:+ start:22314 stop:23006 length:693 start_codon:yes stop_codon:yes gene_type:complete
MCSLENLNNKATQTAFNKKVVSVTQHLRAYVNHRIYIAESTGVIPKNMYNSNDFIDEAIAKFYENGYNIDDENLAIKLKLFKIVDSDMDDLFKKEAFHKNTMSTHSILQEELDGLDEKFTVDEDFDFIMNEELNDISYQQDNKHKHVFVYADNNSSLMNAFEIEDLSSDYQKDILGKFYSWLPFIVSDIVDLFIFGKLTYDEIAEVKNIETKRVERIINLSFKSLRSNLD